MIFTDQAEYNEFYDKLKRYAESRAHRLFSDMGLRNDVVDRALDAWADELMKNPPVDSLEAFARDIVYKSLKMSFRDKKIDLAPADIRLNQEGRQVFGSTTRIYQVVSRRKFPKVRILELLEGKEKEICLLYWRDGLTQGEVAAKMGVTKQFISQIIVKYSK